MKNSLLSKSARSLKIALGAVLAIALAKIGRASCRERVSA